MIGTQSDEAQQPTPGPSHWIITKYIYWLRGSVYLLKFLMQFSAWDQAFKKGWSKVHRTCSSRVLIRAGRRPWMPRVCLSSRVNAMPLNRFGSLGGICILKMFHISVTHGVEIIWLSEVFYRLVITCPKRCEYTWGSPSLSLGWEPHQCCWHVLEKMLFFF